MRSRYENSKKHEAKCCHQDNSDVGASAISADEGIDSGDSSNSGGLDYDTYGEE